jgi:LacI family transcriptional regulator
MPSQDTTEHTHLQIHRAITDAVAHLKGPGHKRIAFLRGQAKSSDLAARSEAIQEVAQEFDVQIRPERVPPLERMESSPELGYPYGKALIARGLPFTALFA